jgi:hypothetical protein
MRLQTRWPVFLCVALLAGSFAAGLALMGSASTADREEATSPAPPGANPEPKAAGEAKAEQAPPQLADQGPGQAPPAPPPPPRPEPKKRPLAFGEMSEADRVVGQRVTWVARPISSNSDGGGTQHVFFGKGTRGEFSFGSVFLVKEAVPYAESPLRRALKDLRDRYVEGRHQEFRDKQRLRAEERDRQNEELRKATEELRKGNPQAMRKRAEESRKRLAESRDPDKIAERRAKAQGNRSQTPPILVTVTGTITRFDALILLGHGQSSSVPVLRDVTVAPYPQPAEKR